MSRKLKFGRYSINLPGSRVVRTLIGVAMIAGGLVGFLPVVGFWMVPLGILVLSLDWPIARRLRRRFETWWGRTRKKYRERNEEKDR